jgi:hypothetical protein
MQWADFPRALMSWVQNAGALAALATLIWFIATLAGSRLEKRRINVPAIVIVVLAASWLGVFLVAGLFILNWVSDDALHYLLPTRGGDVSVGDWMLTVAGALALAVVLAPVLIAVCTRLRFGRIWAVARLSLKEAVRSKVVLIFGAMALVFLFADWFVPYKPENQVRNYVRVLYWSMTPLFLMTASLLGAFGIPTDVKSQSIHTIVTKPVEKFEVVLGRFLGYAVLMTVGLAAVTAASLIYVVRGVTEEARQESYTAREPLYGRLSYYGTKERDKGENVGRVYDVRGYITGPSPARPNMAKQSAVWTFPELPRAIGADGNPVRVEFGFDIFRLTKGVENQGLLCTFVFADGRLPSEELFHATEAMKREYDQKMEALQKRPGTNAQKAEEQLRQELLEKYRIHVTAGFNVTDYHTQHIMVPGALFEQLRKQQDAEPRNAQPGEEPPPVFQIGISVDFDHLGKNQQMLGVAHRDLYVLAAEHSFFVNFIKGIIGLWCLMILVLGVAVACSTYLSGVISWLCTIFLLIAGIFVTDIQQLAENRSEGGGPIEAAVRLVQRVPAAGEIDEGPVRGVIMVGDEIYRWWLRRFLNLVPEVTRYDLHPYVANGFDISWTRVLLLDNLVPLVGHLFPWAILAFYLMKYREIANPM